jgi:hypothetical protein
MTTPDKPDRLPSGRGVESIFPTFEVNVPMPRDTAVPGSFNKPAQQYSSDGAASRPSEAAR